MLVSGSGVGFAIAGLEYALYTKSEFPYFHLESYVPMWCTTRVSTVNIIRIGITTHRRVRTQQASAFNRVELCSSS